MTGAFGWTIRVSLLLLLLLLLLLSGIPAASRADQVSFNRDVRPILSENCFQCHGPDARSREAGLRLDTEEGAYALRNGIRAVVPGSPEESEILRRIGAADPRDRMPPPDSGKSLGEGDAAILEAWIASGAAYQRHWAFEPIVRPPLPETRGRAEGAIDRFLLARLEERGWGFRPQADRETLLRRLRFDITGLPPTPGEIDAFVGDVRPGSYRRLVDALLADPGYGERMASEWLDVARYSDSYGYQVDRDRFVWPWRDWVVDSFNANMPYRRFVIEQLAGDMLPGARESQILATTFNRLHPQKVEGGSVPEEFRIEYVSDRTQTAGTAFLGLTLECARCHDHKYDPLSQKEYYQLTSFFANIDEAGLYSFFTSSVPTPTLALGDAGGKEELRRLLREAEGGEAALAEAAGEAGPAFEAWLEGQGGPGRSPGGGPGLLRLRVHGEREDPQPEESREAGLHLGSQPAGGDGGREGAGAERRRRGRPEGGQLHPGPALRRLPAAADRRAPGPGRGLPPLPGLDRRRQPGLPDAAGGGPPQLLPDPLLAGQRHPGQSLRAAGSGSHGPPGGVLRRLDAGRGDPALRRRPACGGRDGPGQPLQETSPEAGWTRSPSGPASGTRGSRGGWWTTSTSSTGSSRGWRLSSCTIRRPWRRCGRRRLTSSRTRRGKF